MDVLEVRVGGSRVYEHSLSSLDLGWCEIQRHGSNMDVRYIQRVQVCILAEIKVYSYDV